MFFFNRFTVDQAKIFLVYTHIPERCSHHSYPLIDLSTGFQHDNFGNTYCYYFFVMWLYFLAFNLVTCLLHMFCSFSAKLQGFRLSQTGLDERAFNCFTLVLSIKHGSSCDIYLMR